MTRTAASKVYADFSGGYVTEANPLSYPENAAIDMDNMDLVENGTIQRRLGLAYDASEVISFPATLGLLTETATNVFKWDSVNGDPALNIAVVQVGDVLHFYYMRDDSISSATEAASAITLSNTIRSSGSTSALRKSTDLQVASGGGKLYVAGKYVDPFVLEFTEPLVQYDTGTITQTTLNLKIRDFDIFKEGETVNGYSLAGEEEQDYMSGAHFYNLANQGWPSNASNFSVTDTQVSEVTATCSSASNPDSGTTDTNPARYTYDTTGVEFFPTIAHSFQQYQAGGGQTVSEQIAYSPWLLENDYTGNTPAARGKFIKEAFYIARKALGNVGAPANAFVSALTDAVIVDEIESSNTRPETIAFYAGRVWYGGLSGAGYTNNIYFSQVINDDIDKASKCYQEADPTAQTINELIATDGGLFNLEGVGKVYRMEPIGPSLAIVADNGVWVISGDGEFSSFTATSFSIRKVTDQGAVNSKSIVFAKDSMYYWGETALYRLQLDQAGALVAVDITSSTIKSFYQETNVFNKQGAFSVFDEGSNKILWFYSNTTDSSFNNVAGKDFNSCLYYDISLNAFGKYTMGITSSILPVSAVNTNVLTTVTVTEPVTDGGVQVTDGGVDVTVSASRFVPDRTSVKLLTVTGNSTDGWSYRFSDFSNLGFTDWGNDYSSYVETGFDSLGDIISKAKKAPILQAHFSRTEDGFTESLANPGEFTLDNQSSCLVSYKWDWGEAPLGNQFQAYRLLKNYTPTDATDPFSYDRSVITTRNRLRGRGTSLGLRFESEEGKDLRLLGYGVVFSNRGRV